MTKERQTDRSDEKSGTGWVRQPVPLFGFFCSGGCCSEYTVRNMEIYIDEYIFFVYSNC